MKIAAEIKTIFNSRKNPLKAIATIIIDDCFMIKSVRLVEGKKGMFVSMPSKMNASGDYVEQCHPLTATCKEAIDDAVMMAYEDFKFRF